MIKKTKVLNVACNELLQLIHNDSLGKMLQFNVPLYVMVYVLYFQILFEKLV